MKINFNIKNSKLKSLKILIIISTIILFTLLVKNLLQVKPLNHNCLSHPPNCHDFTGINLTTIDIIKPSANSIFFLEDHNHQFISPRVLCAVESAARTNPKRFTYLLTTTHEIYRTPVLSNVLASNKNIYFGYLSTDKLFNGTPLQEWYINKEWEQSEWPVYHFSDAVRWLMLWKYGGVYLDTDVILMRELPNMSFVALESNISLGAGAISLPPKHTLLSRCINQIATRYDPNIWGNIGPELLTKALIDSCGDWTLLEFYMKCSEIKVMPTKSFYPIYWKEWKKYYNVGEQKVDFFGDKQIFGLHVWNALSKHEPVDLSLNTIFANAAKKFCPVVVGAVKDKM